MDVSNWTWTLQMESRQQIVNKILETLKTHLPLSSQEELNELEQIAVRFEEKIFTAATSQSDYLRKISLKMLAMGKTKPQNPIDSFLPSISVGNGKNPSNTGNFISQRWLRAVKSELDDLGVEAKDVSYTSLVVRHNNLFQLASNVIETAVVSEEASEVLRESLELAHEKIKLMYANEDGGLSTTDVISSQVVFNEPHQVGAKGYRRRLNGGTEKKRKKSNFPKQNNMPSPCENNVYGVDMDENDEDDDDDDDDLFYTPLDFTAQTEHVEDGDWQEEVYLKIKTMKEMYLPELTEIYQKIAAKLQQHDSLPQQPKTDQLEKLKIFKTMVERIITYLQVTKNNITPYYKEKLGTYDKQIINFLNANRPRKPVSSMQQGQLPPPHMHSLQQSQQAQSHSTQVQPHENQNNPHLQAMNLQGSVPTMQQNNITNMQHGSMSSLSVVPNAQQNMMNSLQSGSNLDSGQGNAMSSFQQVAVGSLQQNPVNASNQTTMNTLSSQGEAQLKCQQQRQMQKQLLQKQQILQQQQNQQPVTETANTATTAESAAAVTPANEVTNN